MNRETEQEKRFRDTFGDKYRYIRRIGEGGMGEVWLVEHTGLKKRYAMKAVFAAGEREDELRRLALFNEAERMKTIRDPRIPYLIDYLENDRGAALVMEYVEGDTLKHYLETHAPLSGTEARRIMGEICGILACLHGQRPRIIYRDIKAENFIRTREGRIVLLDFGTSLAGYRNARCSAYTPGYAAPEQTAGRPVGPEADVYALGALYTYLLTGQDPSRPPYRPADPDLYGVRIDADTKHLVKRCLSSDPAARFADASGMLDALCRLPEGRTRGSLFHSLTEVFYPFVLAVNIIVWILVIYAREKGFHTAGFEYSAVVLLAATAGWGICRAHTERKARFFLARDWNLLLTEKQAPGL